MHKKSEIEKRLESLVERLAALEHERWAHWQRYVHTKGRLQPDGSLLLPSALVSQWEKQIEASYDHLSEAEKQSDRDQVHRYLPLIASALRDTHE